MLETPNRRRERRGDAIAVWKQTRAIAESRARKTFEPPLEPVLSKWRSDTLH